MYFCSLLIPQLTHRQQTHFGIGSSNEVLIALSPPFLLRKAPTEQQKAYLMSMTWLTITLGWDAFPSAISYRKSLKSQITASALCQPFFTPAGFGTFSKINSDQFFKSLCSQKSNRQYKNQFFHLGRQTFVQW